MTDVELPLAPPEPSSSAAGAFHTALECGASDATESSPLRDEWPESSLLSRDHFTIDIQCCLNCGKRLGYAMPMNRIPKIHYLFCENCPKNLNFLRCLVCGNFNNDQSGTVVHRPGNSGYSGPSQIYSFMCHHCLKDQKEQEPGLEETKEMMRRVREERKQKELEESGRTTTIDDSLRALQPRGVPSLTTPLLTPSAGDKRKRARFDDGDEMHDVDE